MPSGDIVPNADILAEWSNTGGTHESCIDEGLPPTLGDMISCSGSGSNGDIDNFNMETIDIAGGTISSIEVKIYHESWMPVCSCVPFTVDINLGGWQGSKNYTTTEVLAWESQTWAGLAGSQADLNALQVKITAGNLQTADNCVTVHDTIWLYTVIVEVTWVAAPVGYGHDFMGVPAANIGSVSGVPTANIASIKGV